MCRSCMCDMLQRVALLLPIVPWTGRVRLMEFLAPAIILLVLFFDVVLVHLACASAVNASAPLQHWHSWTPAPILQSSLPTTLHFLLFSLFLLSSSTTHSILTN